MYTPDWLTDPQRAYVRKASNRLEMWQRLIEVGFRQRCKKFKRKTPLVDQLGHDAAARYGTLLDILDKDLRGIIELRNRLAHGEWVYGLTGTGRISPNLTKRLKDTNTLELRFQDSIAEDMANAVGDLLMPGKKFEDSFDRHYGKIRSSHNQLRNLDFNEHVRILKQTKRDVRVTKVSLTP